MDNRYYKGRQSIYDRLPKEKLHIYSKVYHTKHRLNNADIILRNLLDNELTFVTEDVIDSNTNWDELPINTVYNVVSWNGLDAPSERLFGANTGVVMTVGTNEHVIYQLAFNMSNLAVRDRRPGANWTYMHNISLNELRSIYSHISKFADQAEKTKADIDNTKDMLDQFAAHAITEIKNNTYTLQSNAASLNQSVSSLSSANTSQVNSLANSFNTVVLGIDSSTNSLNTSLSRQSASVSAYQSSATKASESISNAIVAGDSTEQSYNQSVANQSIANSKQASEASAAATSQYDSMINSLNTHNDQAASAQSAQISSINAANSRASASQSEQVASINANNNKTSAERSAEIASINANSDRAAAANAAQIASISAASSNAIAAHNAEVNSINAQMSLSASESASSQAASISSARSASASFSQSMTNYYNSLNDSAAIFKNRINQAMAASSSIMNQHVNQINSNLHTEFAELATATGSISNNASNIEANHRDINSLSGHAAMHDNQIGSLSNYDNTLNNNETNDRNSLNNHIQNVSNNATNSANALQAQINNYYSPGYNNNWDFNNITVDGTYGVHEDWNYGHSPYSWGQKIAGRLIVAQLHSDWADLVQILFDAGPQSGGTQATIWFRYRHQSSNWGVWHRVATDEDINNLNSEDSRLQGLINSNYSALNNEANNYNNNLNNRINNNSNQINNNTNRINSNTNQIHNNTNNINNNSNRINQVNNTVNNVNNSVTSLASGSMSPSGYANIMENLFSSADNANSAQSMSWQNPNKIFIYSDED